MTGAGHPPGSITTMPLNNEMTKVGMVPGGRIGAAAASSNSATYAVSASSRRMPLFQLKYKESMDIIIHTIIIKVRVLRGVDRNGRRTD